MDKDDYEKVKNIAEIATVTAVEMTRQINNLVQNIRKMFRQYPDALGCSDTAVVIQMSMAKKRLVNLIIGTDNGIDHILNEDSVKQMSQKAKSQRMADCEV